MKKSNFFLLKLTRLCHKYSINVMEKLVKKSVLVLLLTVMVLNTLSAQFYKDFSDEKRKETAEAYYLVGQQYLSVGSENGQAYIDMAYSIYPELDPSQIKDPETA